jgi:hypothetical protein
MMGVLWIVAVLTMGRKSPSTTAKITPQAFETEEPNQILRMALISSSWHDDDGDGRKCI